MTALWGCGPADDAYFDDGDLVFRSDDGGVPAPSGRPSGGGWISNGLEDPEASGVDPSYALSSAEGLSPAMGLLTDPGRLGTAQYLVECALPHGRSVSKTVDDEVVVLHGLLGLAPQWETGPCDEDCQEWVSACLLARTNASGQLVQVWFKGDHEAIGWDAPQGALFEAGFFGNLFADPLDQHYCKGTGKGMTAARREGRTCSSGNDCDFVKHSKCFADDLCARVGPNADVPADCTVDDASLHTIATYVVP